MASMNNQLREWLKGLGYLNTVLVYAAFATAIGVVWVALLVTVTLCANGCEWPNDLPDPVLLSVTLVGGMAAVGMLTGLALWPVEKWKAEQERRQFGREPTPPGTGDPDAG